MSELNRRIAEALGGDLNVMLSLPLAEGHKWDIHYDVGQHKAVVSILNDLSGIAELASGKAVSPVDIATVGTRCWLAWKAGQGDEPRP